jgi:hypothetical protein
MPLIIGGVFLTYLGFAFQTTKESGLWKEICEKTTYWERLAGRVPMLKDEQFPPPFFRRRTILILGSFMMTMGILITIATIFFKVPFSKDVLISSSVFATIFGLLFIIFSIVFLKGK